jgi:hypothetical protein
LAYFIVTQLPEEQPKDTGSFAAIADRLLALEQEFGPFPGFNNVASRIGIQLALMLLKQFPDEEKDYLETRLPELFQNANATIFIESIQVPIRMIWKASSPEAMLANLEQRCPFRSAILYIRAWLENVPMYSEQPSHLEMVYTDLVGDLHIQEPSDLDEFRPIPIEDSELRPATAPELKSYVAFLGDLEN